MTADQKPALEYVAYMTHGKIGAIEEESLLNLSARSRFSRLALHEDIYSASSLFCLDNELHRLKIICHKFDWVG